MKTIRRLAFLSWIILSISVVRADEVAREAKIVAVQGSASVSVPGEAGKSAVVGAALPAGSSIRTNAGSLVTVQFFDGTTAVVQPDTDLSLEKISTTTTDKKVTKETALINLRVGTVISTLDSSKKAVNDYSVRTPRGVAAARGTVFAVNVEIDGKHSSVATLTGEVTFYTDKGPISVPLGKFCRTGGDEKSGPTSGAYVDLAKSDPKLAAELIAAIQTIATGISNGTIPDRPGVLQALSEAAGVIDPAATNLISVPQVITKTPVLTPIDVTIPVVSPAAP